MPVSKAGAAAAKARSEPKVDMAEIRKNAQSLATQVADQAKAQETHRREQEKMERLYRPTETSTAAVYKATDRATGDVAKVDGVLWTVKENSGVKKWVPAAPADGSEPRSVLNVCGGPPVQGQCQGRGLSWSQGCAGQDVGPAQASYASACVPGRSPFSLEEANAACAAPAYSSAAASFNEPLANRPVRLPKVLPAVDAATANEAAAWVQAARLHEQLACADAAAKQRLQHAKQQYYLSIGLLCDADEATVKQRLEAVVHASAARAFELSEQKAAQCNLEAEIIAAQQVMRDVQQDLEGKHAQGDSFGVQYAAEEFKLAKYKVLLLLKQKRRLKAMVAIHACNVREAANAQGVAEREFADAMARHEYARHLMRVNHDLDDGTQELLADVNLKLEKHGEDLLRLEALLSVKRTDREAMEAEIKEHEKQQSKALGLSGGQQRPDGALRRPNHATRGASGPAGPVGGGGSDGATGPALAGGVTQDELEAYKIAREKINDAFRKDLNEVYTDPNEMIRAMIQNGAGDEDIRKQKEKKKLEDEATMDDIKKLAHDEQVKAQKAIQEAAERVEGQLQAQEHRNHVSASVQASTLAKLKTGVERGFLGIDDMTNRRGIANGVQYLMSLRFRARRYRDEEAEIRAKIARVQQIIQPLQLERDKLELRLKEEKDKEDAVKNAGQPAAQATNAPAVAVVAAHVATTEGGCELAPIGTLNKDRHAAITEVEDAWPTTDVTVGMKQGTRDGELQPCYGRIVKLDAKGKTCDFVWFYEGGLKKTKPDGLGTFVCIYSNQVQRLRGEWAEGDVDKGILETWTTCEKARTEPPNSVHIGKLTTKLSLADDYAVTNALKVEETVGINFTRDEKEGKGVLKRGPEDTLLDGKTKTARQEASDGTILYTFDNNRHLLYYYPPVLDSRTAAAYCWQWENAGADAIKGVVLQVGTVINQPQALAASYGERAANTFSLFGVTSATKRATREGPWDKAVHTGMQCIFDSASTGGGQQKHVVTGYKDGVQMRTSTGEMLCGLPHGSHQVQYAGADRFFGRCFNGGPYRGYATVNTGENSASSFWGTFLTPSVPSFDDAWQCLTNTGRRKYTGQSDVETQYCRQKVTGEDNDKVREKATDEAVKGANAADQTGLQALPPVVFQEYAQKNASLCGGADAAHSDAPGASGHDDGGAGPSDHDNGEPGIEGGTYDAALGAGESGAGVGPPGAGAPAPAPHAAGAGVGGGDGREWDGGISPAWLHEATRRVDDLCAQLARLRTRALPPSAQGELGARALQYASTFADVLKKKPVCGPGLLRPLARNMAAALDASFAGLANANVMAQLAAWFRLEC